MSLTIITMITLGVVLCCTMILLWKRDLVILLACPREISLIDGTEERRRVHGIGMIAFLKQRRTWLAFGAYFVGLSVLAWGIAELTIAATREGQWRVIGVTLAAIEPVVMALFLGLLMWVRERKWMRVFLRKYLNDHGIPICENCGYDLRGQVHPRCSECGRESSRVEQVDELP